MEDITAKSEVLHGLPDIGGILAGERPPREKEIRRREKPEGTEASGP